METERRKNVLITGANGGIGRSILEAFAAEGSNILAQMRSEKPEFLEYAATITEKYNIRITPIYFNLAQEEQVKTEIGQLRKSKIPVDVLVNNAGAVHGGLLQMTPLADIRRIYDVNFFAVVQMMQLVSRMMARQGGGTIVNIASISGLELAAGNVAYGTSKAAVIALTKTAAKELAGQNIRVNAVAPGLTDTRMAELMEEKAGEAMLRNTAFHRLAKPGEIADAVVYLASEKASFITGQVLRVDGGV
jgi:3-oxoacyl-[acyl-carrier protein] reductase